MGETVKNPFDPKNFTSGGGLWEGKTITVLSAKAILDPLKRGDGTPVLDDKTGEPVVKRVMEITAIADDQEYERRETYSVGQLIPTQDGEGFVHPNGSVVPFHKTSEAGLFFEGAVQGGFDTSVLWDATTQRQSLSKLVGARFTMKGEVRLDKSGNEKKNAKGYTQHKFFPVKFEGYKAGVAASTGNGSADGLKDKATVTMLEILAEAGEGVKVSRTDLIRKISAKLAGDADSSKVIALITKDSFHAGQSWKRDGASFAL